MVHASLERHPQSTNTAVRRIDASVSRGSNDILAVSYLVEGDLERLRVPAWESVRMGERLWERTCFEIFIKRDQVRLSRAAASIECDPVYHELNFAPSGSWAAYAFQGYRKGARINDAPLESTIAVRRREKLLELEATVSLEGLSPEYIRAPLALALSAVIEDGEGVLSYWALAHPPGKPDFHHPKGFILKMDPGSSPG